MLTSRIELLQEPTESLEAEDIFASASDQLFPDSTRVFHGDAGTRVQYNSAAYGALVLTITDPADEHERSKFAHALWNASILLCEMIGGTAASLSGPERGSSGKEDFDGRNDSGIASIRLRKSDDETWSIIGESVLELGAGAGLAGIVSALAGAKEVFITDYPLPRILQNISLNVFENIPERKRCQVQVNGHEWGKLDDNFAEQYAHHFSCIIATDTLWMKSQHTSLCQSIAHFLAFSSNARAIIVAGFHTGRHIVASFLEEVNSPCFDMIVDSVCEIDICNQTRPWMGYDFVEPLQERIKWHVVAILKRPGSSQI